MGTAKKYPFYQSIAPRIAAAVAGVIRFWCLLTLVVVATPSARGPGLTAGASRCQALNSQTGRPSTCH